MHKVSLIFKSKGWIIVLLGFLLLNLAGEFFNFRFDLTKEKRYTLSSSTREMVRNLEDVIYVDVFMKGEFPAGFKKLANSTSDLLEELKVIGKQNIQYRFINPFEDYSEADQESIIDSLYKMGLQPTNLRVQGKVGEEESQRTIFPGALVRYKDEVVAIDLLKGASNVTGFESLNNAEALLEYKFSQAIDQLTRKEIPLIAFTTGHGEPLGPVMNDAIKILSQRYYLDTLHLPSSPYVPADISALVMMKPGKAFNDADKLKIDQYLMNGGKVFFLLDNLYAEMDSLFKSNGFVAYDKGLNLDDLLFKYGVRINQDLVQDYQCDVIPLVVGSMGGKPQTQLVKWPYFPILEGSSNNPISKNLDGILTYFPNSIDTVKADQVRKTVLLSTSNYGRKLGTPAEVSFESLKVADDPNAFNSPDIPVAVLLEGKFTSLYNNRLGPEEKQQLAGRTGKPFKAESESAKIIVVADGDIGLNSVTQMSGPLPMGMNQFTKYQFGNPEFFSNSVEYLVGNTTVLDTRMKDFSLRMLDRKKLEEEKGQWQAMNLVIPPLLILVSGIFYNRYRKNKYSK